MSYNQQPPPAGFSMPQPSFGYGNPNVGYQPGYMPPQNNIPMQPPVNAYQPPAGANFMPPVASFPGCPPGLEYLTQLNQVLVKQKVEMLEAFIGFETCNKYTIKNSMGQKVYTAKEVNDCLTRVCCGASRSFTMDILDHMGNRVLKLRRPYRCNPPCCCPPFLQEVQVFDMNEVLLGSVTQNWTLFKPDFSIRNAAGESVLKITGPWCTFSMCGDVEFVVRSRDRSVKVGRIVKQWSGLAREYFTDADHFGISFPMDLDVSVKAVLLGAVFLIDFMFFEKSGNNNN